MDQTFENDPEVDIAEVRRLLDVNDCNVSDLRADPKLLTEGY